MCRSLDTVAYCLQYAMLLCFSQAYCQSLHQIILPHIVKAYIISDGWLNWLNMVKVQYNTKLS